MSVSLKPHSKIKICAAFPHAVENLSSSGIVQQFLQELSSATFRHPDITRLHLKVGVCRSNILTEFPFAKGTHSHVHGNEDFQTGLHKRRKILKPLRRQRRLFSGVVAMFSLVDVSQCFRGLCRLHYQGTEASSCLPPWKPEVLLYNKNSSIGFRNNS